MVGENARAAKLADDVDQKRPYDTLVQFVDVPLVKAQIELNQGGSTKAIDLLDSALVYARANTGVLYIRGNAYLKAGRGGDAVQAFQRLLDLKNVISIDPACPSPELAWLAPTSWPETRPAPAWPIRISSPVEGRRYDLPILRDVKAEYARLQ